MVLSENAIRWETWITDFPYFHINVRIIDYDFIIFSTIMSYAIRLIERVDQETIKYTRLRYQWKWNDFQILKEMILWHKVRMKLTICAKGFSWIDFDYLREVRAQGERWRVRATLAETTDLDKLNTWMNITNTLLRDSHWDADGYPEKVSNESNKSARSVCAMSRSVVRIVLSSSDHSPTNQLGCLMTCRQRVKSTQR